MSKDKWFKFYPADWLSDPNLNACSYTARGIWIDLICQAHNSEKYGFLTINGQNLTEKSLKKVKKWTKKESKAFSELVQNGVIAQSDDGAFYVHRLLKERDLVELARENGKKGGNPSLKVGVNPRVKGTVKLELRNKNKEIRDKNIYMGEKFARWWDLYQKKRGRKEALEFWLKMTEEDQDLAIEKTPEYVRSTPDPTKRKDPIRYLRKRGFDDDIFFEGDEQGNDAPLSKEDILRRLK